VWGGSFFEYILCTQGSAAAEAAGRAFLIANPAVQPRFEAGRADVRKNGVPKHHADMAYDLAAYELVADLDLTI
jgi:predicted rRNA methylase YqxC with S4 and FtsJ domains